MSDSVQSGVIAHCESEVAVSCEFVAFVFTLSIAVSLLLYQSSGMWVASHAFQSITSNMCITNWRDQKEWREFNSKKGSPRRDLNPQSFPPEGNALSLGHTDYLRNSNTTHMSRVSVMGSSHSNTLDGKSKCYATQSHRIRQWGVNRSWFPSGTMNSELESLQNEEEKRSSHINDGITTLLNNTKFALTAYFSTQSHIASLRTRWFHMMNKKVLTSVPSRCVFANPPISTLINSTLMELKSREEYKEAL